MAEENDKRLSKKNNDITNGLTTESSLKLTWLGNVTVIDLSARNLDRFDDNIIFPENLIKLNLSHNKLIEIPILVLQLKKLKNLNLSHNAIEYFDDTPQFCHTLERLDISMNVLKGPPYWIWTEKPKKLSWVNISCNSDITKSFYNGYLEELLQHTTLVLEIDMHNCGLNTKHEELLATFKNAKTINFGTDKYCYHAANAVGEIPNNGMKICCNIEQLNLSNTHIHTINSGIIALIKLKELNLSCNNIVGLPNEFCSLLNLETCRLSSNGILYLPDNMCKLTKLTRLYLDNNHLCMLPEKLLELPKLQVLDLYDNNLNEVLGDYSSFKELDLAQNYLDEPTDDGYLEKKDKLRLLHKNRYDGRKAEPQECECTSIESDDEQYYRDRYKSDSESESVTEPQTEKAHSVRSSSPEDWDSDSYWVPHAVRFPTPPHSWIHYVTQKMREGNFCPMDAHVVSIGEQVIYEKKLSLKVDSECPGQYDDYSSDNS